MPRHLANWLRSYAEFTQLSEAPDMFNFWTGVSTIAGALRRNVWIDQIKFKWYPNFYIIFVSPPGVVTKSSTIGVGMRLLDQVEGVVMGPQSMTWQGLAKGLQEASRLIPMGPSDNPLTASYMTQSAMTCEVSELGSFLDTRDAIMSSVLIDLWDGKDGNWERMLASKDNTKIENPWINIIGATTPSWLRENFQEGMIGGGLTSRVVFVYADAKKRLVAYIMEETNAKAHEDLERALVHDLNEIGELRGNYKLTREAIQLGTRWYEEHWSTTAEHLAGDNFEGYRARKQTHVHKLAMVLAAAESDKLIIEEHHLDLAIKFITAIEYDMNKVFESIGVVASTKHVTTMLNYLRIYSRMSKQELWRYCIKSMSPREFAEATEAAVQAGFVMLESNGASAYFNLLEAGRRKSTIFAVHDSERKSQPKGP